MSILQLNNLHCSRGKRQILRGCSLSIAAGTLCALLGPSGCGKTTLLRLIAGLEKAQEGQIFLDGIDITSFPPAKRAVHMVFQHYALFPHLSTFENIAYPLRLQRIDKQEIEKRVIAIATTTRIAEHLSKYPENLSGGEQQRTALARALIGQPKVLLLDEPLAALDRLLREQLMTELRSLQKKMKMTCLYITHEPEEALSIADQLAVLYEGKITQQGPPERLYEEPLNGNIAELLGPANLIKGVAVDAHTLRTPWGDLHCAVTLKIGEEVVCCLRPERIVLSSKPQDSFANRFAGRVASVTYHGHYRRYQLSVDGKILLALTPSCNNLLSSSIYLHWRKEDLVLL